MSLQNNIQKVVELTNQGFGPKDISDKLGLKPSTVNLYKSMASAAGHQLIKTKPRRPAKRKELAKKLYSEGKNLDEIGKIMNISKDAVYAHIKPRENKTLRQSEIFAAHEKGLKCREIAEKFGVKIGTVFTALHRERKKQEIHVWEFN